MNANVERGFEGSVTASSVADVLQLQSGNRFSGSIVFTYEGHEAAVYMQHGEVVHAEHGELRGEEVLGTILGWPTGAFQAHANVATMARTIDKRLDHLLLDAARRLDEARKEAPPRRPAPPRAGAAPATPAARPAVTTRVRAVPGVTGAAVLKGGAAVGDQGPEAAALATRSAFLLSMLANPLGKALGLGDVARVALSNPEGDQLLLIHAKDAYLAVTMARDATLSDVEAGVRRAVAARPGA
ncbi:MAG: DUF4388 domain-containing protein [Anaeromyxobacteraceae bacterium]|nr:DUF4388 domain-containing protein [Anaeromyxobacteraceae bacterium]